MACLPACLPACCLPQSTCLLHSQPTSSPRGQYGPPNCGLPKVKVFWCYHLVRTLEGTEHAVSVIGAELREDKIAGNNLVSCTWGEVGFWGGGARGGEGRGGVLEISVIPGTGNLKNHCGKTVPFVGQSRRRHGNVNMREQRGEEVASSAADSHH